MSARVFCSVSLKDLLDHNGFDSQQLKDDFAQYKDSGIPPFTFGRDAEYNHPNGPSIVRIEKISHIHIEDPLNPWPRHARQYTKTSDTHLVYCQGFYDADCYLLMAILSPNAHEQALNNNIMHKLGKMAEKFRSKY